MEWKSSITALVVLVAGCGSDGAAVQVQLPIVSNGAELEVGETYRYPFQIHCGMEWLGEFSATAWKTDDPIYDGTGYSEDLRQFFRNPDEQISPELWTYVTLADEGEIRLTLPDESQGSTYRPTAEERPGCA